MGGASAGELRIAGAAGVGLAGMLLGIDSLAEVSAQSVSALLKRTSAHGVCRAMLQPCLIGMYYLTTHACAAAFQL